MFNYINDILHYKKGDLLDNIDSESEYNPYMINRWISMYSPQMAQLVNYTSNRLYSAFPTKRDTYKFLVTFLPKVKQYRIKYIKKPTKNKEDTDEAISLLARNLELSKREINLYVEELQLDAKKICH